MGIKNCGKSIARWLTVLTVSTLLSIAEGKTLSNACSDLNCREVPDSREDWCETPGCVHAASALLKNMDQNVNPCEDFYRYACGGFVKQTILPDDEFEMNYFKIIKKKIHEQLKFKIRDEKDDEPRHIRLMRDFYVSCWDRIDTEDAEKAILQAKLHELGGWPVLSGDAGAWDENEFVWTNAIYKFRDAGLFYNGLLTLAVGPDVKNSTKNVIYIHQATLGLGRQHFLRFNDRKYWAYKQSMVLVAVMFGASPENAKQDLDKSSAFEAELANISLPGEDYLNISRTYNPMTLKELSKTYKSIPWEEYFNGLLPSPLTVEEDEVILVSAPSYVEKLEKLLAKTPKRVLANYLMWRVMQPFVDHLNDLPCQRAGNSTRYTILMKIRARSDSCAKAAIEKFPLIAGAMYVKNYFDNRTKENVSEIASNVRRELENILMEASWIDDTSRATMLDKVRTMVSHIGYPDELLNDDKLDKFYEKLNFSENSYFEAKLKLNIFENDYSLGKLREPVNKTEWMSHGQSAAVNPAFQQAENSYQFPAGILQDVFFSNDRPNYMNYGAIGASIGHEMTHGFDDIGKQLDKDGNLVEWAPYTEKHWNSSVRCLTQQYANFTVSELGLRLDGMKMKNENFADNGGIKIAYKAYESWVAKNGPEKKLPGIHLTPKQIFWLSFANVWCEKNNPIAFRSKLASAAHSPGEFRVLGTFANMPEFANDFQCPDDSRMNPRKRCLVW
ncbi:neprilysin-2-like [Venturia canescens]|uniref:neprilysin-2-like n=1 Tax=Venturia canescens TaxID=32260 RepID=UPI001C9CAD11|nr:neprilysin-2-like [Venturia canescens]